MHSFEAPRWGDWGLFLSPVIIPHFSQPLANQFSCLSQNTLWKDQESPQNELRDRSKITETAVNGVQDRMSLFITLLRPICKTGSNDVYFKGSCLMSLTESSNAVNTCSWNYHRILAH